MGIEFYLDDYNKIGSNIYEPILDVNVLKNNANIHFTIDNNNLILSEDYKDKDVIEVVYRNNKYNVIPRFISHTKRFDDEYVPYINDLGAFYTKKSSTFRLWAPFTSSAKLVLNDTSYHMNYLSNGIYEVVVFGNFKNARYHFEITRNNKQVSIPDIFSYSNTSDNRESYLIDINGIPFNKVKPKEKENICIYELSVRDFSSDENAPFKYKRKFKAFLEKNLKLNNNPIGIDYLKTLNISHVQLMPILNFDNDNTEYNWGYNPVNFNTFKSDYLTSNEPEAAVTEFKELVNTLHSNNIKVILDVVYNHVYKIGDSVYEKILPYYFFRYREDNSPGDGSWCGNEIRSEGKFVREYLNLINLRLFNLYDIDGLRFDLACVLDYETINYFVKEAKAAKKDILMYGEGWSMGDVLSYEQRGSIYNSSKMEGFGFFNGEFKDALCGKFDDDNKLGYICGNKELEEKVIKGLEANIEDFNQNNSINYVECHYNYTLYDRLSLLNFADDSIKDISKLALGVILYSKGLPFIHAGQEFLRTKYNNDNSYNLSDNVNKIDWNLMCKNIDVVNYFISLNKFKNEHLANINSNNTYISHYYDLLIYSIGDIDIFINNSEYPYVYNNWITYTDVLCPNGEIVHNISTFDVSSYSIILAKKL